MKTKAAILYKLRSPLVIKDIEIPTLKTGQVLVKILYSGICGAQYNEIIGLKGPDRFLPHLLGHEASAIVEETGPGITKVRRGDYVVLSWIKGDGLDGYSSQYKNGNRMINAGAVTTFSEFAVVSENRITKISKQVSPDVASIIGCAVATGCGIINNTLNAKAGSSIAIFGVGGIGSSVLLGAKARGCSQIIAIDISDKKLKLAKKLGATHTLKADRKDFLKAFKKITPEGVDFSVDASGNKTAMENAFEVIKITGTCVIAGNLSKEEKISLHPFELIKGKRIVGTWGGETVPQKDLPLYANAYQRGDLPIDKLITHCFSLEKINDAFDVLKSGQAGRIILKIHGDRP